MKRNLLKATAAFGLLVAFYLLLGLLAWLVPDWRVREGVQATLLRFDLADDYPKALLVHDPASQDRYTLDNFTDALIVNQALMLRSEGPDGILTLPRYELRHRPQTESMRAALALNAAIAPASATDSVEARVVHYPRYWHCSTFLARIALAAGSFLHIRYALYLFSSLLLLWCGLRLWRTAGPAACLAIVFALLAVNVFVMQFSLQFAPVLILALGAILWLAHHPSCRLPQASLLFFVVGSLTAAFDLITVPTLTLGLPLLAWIALHRQQWRSAASIPRLVAWWLAAYCLTWVAKWALATLLTGTNVFGDAYGEATYWTNGGFGYIGDAFALCLAHLPWILIAPAYAMLLLLAVLRPRPAGWRLALAYLLVALVPLVYYLLMAHPAAHHSWFNYRALATTIAALALALAALVDWPRLLKKTP